MPLRPVVSSDKLFANRRLVFAGSAGVTVLTMVIESDAVSAESWEKEAWATRSKEMLARSDAKIRSSWNKDPEWSFQVNEPMLPSGSAVPVTKMFFRSALMPMRSDPGSNWELPSTSRK